MHIDKLTNQLFFSSENIISKLPKSMNVKNWNHTKSKWYNTEYLFSDLLWVSKKFCDNVASFIFQIKF